MVGVRRTGGLCHGRVVRLRRGYMGLRCANRARDCRACRLGGVRWCVVGASATLHVVSMR
jgi:hypothetical protein